MFFCSVNHRKQHLLSRLCPQGSMFDRNDALVEQERAEAEEKRQRRRRCHSLHWPTRGLDQHLDQQTKSGPQNWVSWVSVRKSTLSCVSSTDHPRMAISPGFRMVSMEFWPPGSTKIARRSSRPWQAAKAGLMVCWMVFDCGYKISSSLYQDYIYINGSRYGKII
jgi:hypothetical protein